MDILGVLSAAVVIDDATETTQHMLSKDKTTYSIFVHVTDAGTREALY
jgi:hypothetical protein